MSKPTQINKRLVAKIPTPGNDSTTLGTSSVQTVNIADGAVTYEKLDPNASFKNVMQGGFQNFVDSQNIMVATTSTGTPAAGTFYSSIPKRSSMIDLSKDLGVNFGINRIAVQNIYRMQDEFGPNGELVFGLVNDIYNQIRFVGPSWTSNVNASGLNVSSNNVNDYIEVTFFGTGLNLLCYYDSNNSDYRVSVDGGAEGSNIAVTGKASVLANRNTTINGIFNAVSNLTLGVHTVKVRLNSIVLPVTGFEILNESTTLKVNQGSGYSYAKKLTLAALQSPTYNTSFDSGTLGIKGGRVLTYLNSVGNFGKIVQPTNASQGNLTSADHTNEEVMRTYYWREFGMGRGGGTFSDDFSNLPQSGANSAAYTLDDDTTTLIGSSVQCSAAAVSNFAVRINANGGFLAITFVGTGLDIMRIDEVDSGTANTWSVTIDGTNVGNLSTSGVTKLRQEKIVSGLPYGTHTVKITQVSSTTFAMCISQFIVYQPKKPSIPDGAIELADFNLMADFVANTTASIDAISTGVLRKNQLREMIYVQGTGGAVDWNGALSVTDKVNGWEMTSDRSNASVYYTFFGTGFDFRFTAAANRSSNISVTLNGLAATTANFPTMVSSVYGTGVSFASGTLDQLDAATSNGAGLRISGLPLATYTVRFNNNTASSFLSVHTIDVITPIHSHKVNSHADIQNTLAVGSHAISDGRKLTPVKETINRKKSWSQAIGMTSAPTTTSTIPVPCPDMSIVVETKVGTNGIPEELEIFWRLDTTGNVANDASLAQVYVDGTAVGSAAAVTKPTANGSAVMVDSIIVPVSPGVHKVELYWWTTANTMTAGSNRRILKARAI